MLKTSRAHCRRSDTTSLVSAAESMTVPRPTLTTRESSGSAARTPASMRWCVLAEGCDHDEHVVRGCQSDQVLRSVNPAEAVFPGSAGNAGEGDLEGFQAACDFLSYSACPDKEQATVGEGCSAAGAPVVCGLVAGGHVKATRFARISPTASSAVAAACTPDAVATAAVPAASGTPSHPVVWVCTSFSLGTRPSEWRTR